MSESDRRHRMIRATATRQEVDRGDRADALESGRAAYRLRSWTTAHELLSQADEAATLGGGDLELLARSAYFSGRGDRFLPLHERAYRAHLVAGDVAGAVRCAHWLGLLFLLQGNPARASGWLARGRRSLERSGLDCVEAGYLIALEQQIGAHDLETAHALAERAAGIGERFADADLVACARHLQGKALILAGRTAAGLALLDEAMTAVVAGEVSPLVSGLLYCSVIDACLLVFALDRAREWTSALAEWCDGQPELFAFTGTCRVRRAEILQLQGAWQEAIEEAGRARELGARGAGQLVSAAACYQEGEVHRLRGALSAAEEAYRRASLLGLEPQPGMALLRMAQGQRRSAAAAIRRVVNGTNARTDRMRRVDLLSSHVEIMLAVGEVEDARRACAELEDTARRLACGGALDALAAQARGAIQLAEGDAQAALASLRVAEQRWQQIEAPYAAARLRVLVGLACRALGDHDGADLELDAARAVFAALGAASDLAHLDRLARPLSSGHAHGLTGRELQVLRLIASGMTNKAIAGQLSISEKTVDRHVSNIFVKLDVPSRAAATAYGYEHQLI